MNTFTRVYTGKWDYLLNNTKSETAAPVIEVTARPIIEAPAAPKSGALIGCGAS